MSSLFGGKSREEHEAEKQQEQVRMLYQREEASRRYDDMVTKALERLTRWAFPESQVERQTDGKWQLWHTAENGDKYIDVAVELWFKKGQPTNFFCSESLRSEFAELNREDLDDTLRMCICSI